MSWKRPPQRLQAGQIFPFTSEMRSVCPSLPSRRRSLAPGPPFELIAVRHAELPLQVPQQSHQFLLLLGIGLLRPFNVSCVLKGGGGKREERWSSEESAAGDGSRPLTELADRHSPLEVFFEKIFAPSRSAEPAIPIDDKSEYRPEGDQAPNDCRNPIHGLFASRRRASSGARMSQPTRDRRPRLLERARAHEET